MKNIQSINIIGYGNQAKAWYKNLKDSGLHVSLWTRSKNDAVDSYILGKDSIPEGVLVLLIPDDQHLNFLETYTIPDGNLIIYAHGYSIVHDKLADRFPNLEHALLAPKAIASELRENFIKNEFLGAAVSSTKLKNYNDEQIVILAKNLGITSIVRTSFENECYADLFSEQSLLCSTIPYSIKESFDYLVEQGIEEELAFLECVVESKLIIDTLLKVGFEGLFSKISPHALVGSEKIHKKLNKRQQNSFLEQIWCDIKSGGFNKEFKDTDVNQIRNQLSDRFRDSKIESIFNDFYLRKKEFENKETHDQKN